ncbi:MAG: FHA domain-containing protein [Myxococcota bacterium]
MTDDPIEDLPCPVAWAVARGGPLEPPAPGIGAAAARVFVELAVVRVLAEALGATRALPFTLESTMRLVMLDEMDVEQWLDLFAALDHSGMLELLGLPSELPASVRDVFDASGTPDLVNWLELAPSLDPITVAATVAALTRAARGLYEMPLHLVHRVGVVGETTFIEHRRLVGTGWPRLRRTQHVALDRAALAPSSLGSSSGGPSLVFWDGDSAMVPIPDWLIRWDEPASLWLYGGRFVATGQWRYEGWASFGPRHPDPGPGGARASSSFVVASPSIPTFLQDRANRTDHGADPNAQTGLLTRGDRAQDVVPSQTPGARVRTSTPPRSEPRDPASGASLVLRVLTGPDLMRYVVLERGGRVVIGRNAGAASFVIHHHQISRTHTEVSLDPAGAVTVTDLGSTNGTTVNGRPLGPREARAVDAGAWIGVGPVLTRLEWLTADRRDRLDEIADLAKDGDSRDPVTTLLRPASVADRLPRSLRPSFRDGGTVRGGPELWGILVYVDRLAAIHAQHGERIADRTFRDLARVVQFEVESPGSWTRVGYGELLLPCVGVDEAQVRAEAVRLCEVIGSHPWEAPIDRLTASAVVGRKDPAEPAQDWLRRMRTELRDRRPRTARV